MTLHDISKRTRKHNCKVYLIEKYGLYLGRAKGDFESFGKFNPYSTYVYVYKKCAEKKNTGTVICGDINITREIIDGNETVRVEIGGLK